jgi:inosine/xanthosine triphosphatase
MKGEENMIALGTTNPAKVRAVQAVFTTTEIKALSVSSEVSAQPFSDEETVEGAINRARNAKVEANVTIGIGLEGGVVETDRGLLLCNWGALLASDCEPVIAGGLRIPLPEDFVAPLKSGRELGEIIDEYAKKENVRQNEGAIGILTGGYISREQVFTDIVKALVGQYKQLKSCR